MSAINQKEYLKKYLGIGKAPGEKKKKKKKEKTAGNRLKIIDDDVDILISREIEDDLSAANEDAPQIVAVIDERPPSLQVDEKTKSNLWKPIGEPSNIKADSQALKLNSFQLSKQGKSTDGSKSTFSIKKGSINETYSKDISSNGRNGSTVLKIKQENYVAVGGSSEVGRAKSNSPARRNENYNVSPTQRKNDDGSDLSSYGEETTSKKRYKEDYSPLSERGKGVYSPPRKSHRKNASPLRKNKERSLSPRLKVLGNSPRQSIKGDSSPPRRNNRGTDNSPQGKKYEDSSHRRQNNEDYSPLRKRNEEEDCSPPRRRNKKEDNSPPRKRYREEDSSPPRRRNREDSSPPRRRNKGKNNSPSRIRIKEEISSPMRRNQVGDSSPPRRNKKEDSTPPRTRNKEMDSSSPRIRNKEKDKGNNEEDSWRHVDMSPSREKRKGQKSKRTRWASEESSVNEKMEKTLDGKQAGLQNAKDLLKESKYLRLKEDEIFQNMSAEVSGRNAATVVRGKKIKDLEEEAAKEKRQKEMKEKYDRWGKGLKQVEDQNRKIEEQLHEMSKPLARYVDDEDLEKFLKEQEREGDPMLNYIRKKKKKEKVAAGIPEKPMYMGEFMPNRFAIRPGYRWDGVDRSNGYEKKWFQVQNAKKANREEAFKWSTEDM